METIVYIDGYNLFYGRIRGSSFKWLDIYKLFQMIVRIQHPSAIVTKIKYFTAPAKANFASHGEKPSYAQNAYHRALKAVYGDVIEIIEGFHTVEKGTPPSYKRPIDKNDRVSVWSFEEKQTDVNIALHMYRDAIMEKCEQQVLVSNDSDLELALELIKLDAPKVTLGLVIPRSKSAQGKNRSANTRLTKNVNWTRGYILDLECGESQLKEKIPTAKKPIIKPDYW